MAAALSFVQEGQFVPHDQLDSVLGDEHPDTIFVFQRPGQRLDDAEDLGFRFNAHDHIAGKRVA